MPNRWLIAAAGVVMQIALGAVYAWSVFRIPLTQAYGWTIGEVTLAFTIAIFVLGCSAFAGGLWMQRAGPRPVALAAGAFYGAGVFLASFAGGRLWLLYLSYGLIGGIGLGLGYIVPVATLVKWFPDRRGMITGIAVAGFGSGALITAPVATRLIAQVGALNTFAILGVVYLVAVMGAACFMRNPPPGYRPAGWTPSATQQRQRSAHTYTLREAVGSWQWYGLWALLFLNITAGIAVISQAAPMAEEIAGATPAAAAGFVGVIAIANGAGRFLWAWLSDAIGRRAVFLAMFAIQAIVFALLPTAQSLGMLTVLACLVLLCYGGGFGTMPAWTADYFGAENVGSIYGLLLTAWSCAGVLGPMLIAALRESTGGYAQALYVIAGLMLVSTVIPAFVRPPARGAIRQGVAAGVVVIAAVLGGIVASAQRPDRPSTARGEWPTYGGDLASSKYSPLDQITAANFSRLRVAWRVKTPDAVLSMTLPNGAEWTASSREIFAELNRLNPKRWRDGQPPFVSNFKATPLMVGGTLYLNSPSSVAAAYDARTGAVRWVHNPKSYEAGTTTMTARWNQRGVAYWTDGKEERIFFGTGDGYLIAVDARTGLPVRGFGTNGRVDLMTGLPRAARGARDYLNALTYSVQSPPVVVGDLVVTPASISSLISQKEQIPGWIRAYDVRTGQVRWTFHTIPQVNEFGIETWEEDSWAYSGKVTTWSMFSADEELGLLYAPTNTVAPDYYGGHRPGHNLFAESVLALDLKTGRRVWHFQMVHHGLWDYDNPAAPNLLDVTVDGRRIRALAQITKQGFVYAFDRATGAPVWPIEERKVLPSDVPGERASPTQPFPTRPAPFEHQGATIDDLADFTPEIRAMAVKAVQGYRLGPLFTPPTTEGTIQRPGTGGGGNWSGAAVDPETGMLYVPSEQGWSVVRVVPPEPELKSNLRYVQRPRPGPMMPGGLPLFKPPYSRMTAIDMNTGTHAWMVPTGNGDDVRNRPLLKPLNLPPVGGDTTRIGPVLTKTLLVYALAAGGTNDGPRLVAYDKKTGQELGSTDLPGIAVGTPMTYLLGGKQYIALTVRPPGADSLPELVALALP